MSAILGVFSEADVVKSGFRIISVDATLDIGPALSARDESVKTCRLILDSLPSESMAITSLAVGMAYGNRQFSVQIQRAAGTALDNVTVSLSEFNHIGESPAVVAAVVSFVAAFKRAVRALDARDGIVGQLGRLGETKQFLERREVELLKVEELGRSMAAKLADGIAATRARLEEEYVARRHELDVANVVERNRIASMLQEREASLEAREKEITRRMAEIDDRDTRHVRREIRKDQKRELQASAEKFSLTEGTKELRNPVKNASLWLAGSLLVLTVVSSVVNVYLIVTGVPISVAAWVFWGVKQAALTAGFVSALVFYIKWNNRWLEQHASEEFRLKRLGLDLDRASWLVETALEWKTEKGTEPPTILIDRLSSGLFGSDTASEEPLDASERLASAILGASAEVSLPLPTGGSIRFDRKGIESLQKTRSS
ncbi:hypothetical protein [Myxococcus virescens]|uniref:hypothetical protein n=1 Tax=Myxococcus virescens TaxID=83456 RepID=UPI00115F98DA|nr:hypothetical protein [Myxococcus virescens]